MATSALEAESLLAIDIGSVNTRAFLFDIVGGSYRFIASGAAPTTYASPDDVLIGALAALERLQEVTGRIDRAGICRVARQPGCAVYSPGRTGARVGSAGESHPLEPFVGGGTGQ